MGFWDLYPSLGGAKYPLTQTMAIELGIIAAVVVVSHPNTQTKISKLTDLGRRSNPIPSSQHAPKTDQTAQR